MSRSPYKFSTVRVDDDESGKNVAPYATVQAVDQYGEPAQIYFTQSGGSPVSQFTLDANGEKQIWAEPGIYSFSVAGGDFFTVLIAPESSVIVSAEKAKGAWNASTNTPALTSGTGTAGDYYEVSVAGDTSLDGNSGWIVGDRALFNGLSWSKLPASSFVRGPAYSANDQLAIFDGATGKVLKAGQTLSQIFNGWLVSLYNVFPRKVNTFADLASTPAIAGQILQLKEYQAGTGKGGGDLLAKAGAITPNNVTTFASATGGVYFERTRITAIDVSMAGCTGTGDEYTKLQAAIDAAVSTGLPLTGSGAFASNTVLAAESKITIFKEGDCVSQSFKISTSGTNELLKIKGSASSISGLTLEHTGSSGRLLKLENCEAVSVENCRLTAIHATNPDPLIYTHGSNNYVKKCRIDNLRPMAFAIDCDRTSYGININSNFDDNYLGGTGKGLLVHSSDNSARPEGVSWTNNDLVLTGLHVELRCCLSFSALNNMMDQGNPYNYYFNPQSTGGGLEIVDISDRYIATSNPSTGICIYYNPTAAGALKHVKIYDTTIETASKGIVIFGGDTEHITIHDVTIKNITSELFSLSGVKGILHVKDCTFTSPFVSPIYATLADGAGNGKIIFDGNFIDPGATFAITKTVPSNVHLGVNFGKRTSSKVAGTTAMITSGSDVYVSIPHTLSFTPDLDKIQLTARVMSGAFTDVSVILVSADPTNIVAQVFYTRVLDGTIRVSAECSS